MPDLKQETEANVTANIDAATSIIKSKSKKQAESAPSKEDAEAKESPPTSPKTAFVYLGPNLPGGILLTGSVYREKPEHLKGLLEKFPEIDELFIDAKDVPAFKRELEHRGSEAATLYQSAASLLVNIKKGGAQ